MDRDRDEALARRAAAGDRDAFAALYDRYERQAYNLAYRITGSADDAADATQETFAAVLERLPRLNGRELNFGAYVMTAARNASYDAIERRRRTAPAGDIPEGAVPVGSGEETDRPERHALRVAHQEQIRAANERLPERQREVLALREVGELSYDEVAGIMGMNRNSVAQLISRARINLRDNLRATALGSVAPASPLCERALPLLALRQDKALDEEPSAWLAEHLAGCHTCRVRVEAMEEAGVAYRLWLPLVPALWLRDQAAAHAAERAGADWSPRGRRPRARLVAAGGAVFVVALLVGLAGSAQTPVRAFPAAAVPAAGDEPVTKPAKRRAARAPKQPAPKRRASKRRASKPRVRPAVVEEPRATVEQRDELATAARSKPAPAEPVRRRPPAPKATPDPTPTPTPSPDPVVADPPEPTPDPPPPLCPGESCPGGGTVTTPPCPTATTAAACPPEPPPPPRTLTTRLRTP